MKEDGLEEIYQKVRNGERVFDQPPKVPIQPKQSKIKTIITILISATVSIVTSLIALHIKGIVDLSKVL